MTFCWRINTVCKLQLLSRNSRDGLRISSFELHVSEHLSKLNFGFISLLKFIFIVWKHVLVPLAKLCSILAFEIPGKKMWCQFSSHCWRGLFAVAFGLNKSFVYLRVSCPLLVSSAVLWFHLCFLWLVVGSMGRAFNEWVWSCVWNQRGPSTIPPLLDAGVTMRNAPLLLTH